MAKTLYANNAAGLLAANVVPTDTMLLLGAGHGAAFPNPSAGDYFYATVVHATTGLIEIVKCTARDADTLTVERGRDGTTAISFEVGAIVETRLTAGMLEEVDYRRVAGLANGVATLDATIKVPVAQIPAAIARVADVVPNTAKGTADGVATLGVDIKIPIAQIPDAVARVADVVPNTAKGVADGVATLDADALIPVEQIPGDLPYLSTVGSVTVDGGMTATGEVKFATYAGSTAANAIFYASGGLLYLRPSGKALAAGQATLSTAGLFTCADVTTTSDRRKKKLVTKRVPRAALGEQVELYDWRWRGTNEPGRGVIAQQVREFAPEYIREGEDGVLSVDKAGLALEIALGLAVRVRNMEKAQTCSATSPSSKTRSSSLVARRSPATKSRRSSK